VLRLGQKRQIQSNMKLSTVPFALVGALVLAVSPVRAEHTNDPYVSYDRHDHADWLFHPNEFTLDLFGSVSIGQETIDHISGNRIEDDGRLGAGLGGNYFFNRFLGIGADAYTENAGHSFVDNTSGNLILRFPFDRVHLAPYAYGGAGYQFDPEGLWFGQAGGGLEVRFTKTVGIFTDIRYVFTDGTQNFGVGRLGLRLGF
jgi:hypothetical protein